MANVREILKNLTEEDWQSGKYDLHIHTTCSDGEGDYNQILAAAKAKGYKLISITDHNTVEAHRNIKDEILLTGVEFDCWVGYVFVHLLAYGIDINHPAMQGFYAKNKKGTEGAFERLFTTRRIRKLIDAIHEAGGIAVLAHPACCWAINLEGFIKKLQKNGLDGIEAYYRYPRFRKIVKFHSAETVFKIAKNLPVLIVTGGTNFHAPIY